jgi:hypothetical protein
MWSIDHTGPNVAPPLYGTEHGWIESETVPPPIRVADLL